MKVLQIIPNLNVGGAEKVVLNYLRYSKENKGVKMLIVSLYPPTNSQYDQIIKNERLQVIYLNKKKGLDFKIISELKKVIKEFNPDIIHTHLYALKYALLTGLLFNRVNFHTIHSKPEKDAIGIDFFINKICFKLNLVVPIAIQETMVFETNKLYKIKNTRILNNGISFEEYTSIDYKLKSSLNIPEDAYIVGHVGSFKEAKNHKFIIELFKSIYKINKRAYLLLVGEGPLRDHIKEKITEYGLVNRVIFTGNRVDISELLHIMDVFVFPSIYEGLGISLIEAQIMGVYCVASDSIPKEAIISENIGILPLDTKLDKWINAVLYRDLLNENCYDIENYNINNVIKKLLLLYKTELNERSV